MAFYVFIQVDKNEMLRYNTAFKFSEKEKL